MSSITNQMLWTAGIGVPFPWDSAPSRSPRLRHKVGADKFVPTDPQSDRETQSGRPPEESLIKSTLATQLTHTGERPGRVSQSVLVRTSLAHMPMRDTPRFMLQEACFLGVCSNMRVLEGTRSMSHVESELVGAGGCGVVFT